MPAPAEERRGVSLAQHEQILLVSQALAPLTLEVPPLRVSDHLPVAMTVELPESCVF